MFLVPLVVILSIATAFQQAPESEADPIISGTVTINGNVASQGVRLLARDAEGGQDCGVALVGLGGSYSMPLGGADADGCLPGSPLTVILAAAPGAPPATTEVPQGPAAVDLSFTGIRDEAIAAIAADAAIAGNPGDAPSQPASPDPPPSLLQGGELFNLLRLIVVATIVLLSLMVIARIVDSRRRLKFLERIKEWPEPRVGALVKLIGPEGELREYRLFPRQLIEGMVLSVVIIAILVLGSAGRVTQEGLVSVLAAIVGYAAGRASSTT